MGSGASSFRDVERLGYSRSNAVELRKIFVRASKSSIMIGKQGEDKISLHNLLMFLNKDNHPFMHRVFALFDADSSGDVSFYEFASCCMHFCTLTHETIVLFAYALYNQSKSGILMEQEVENMLNELYSGKAADNPQALKMSRALKGCNRQQFKAFCENHQSLLFPAFNLQRLLQKKMLGKRFWKLKTAKLVRQKVKEEREFLKLERKVLLAQGKGKDAMADEKILKDKETWLREREALAKEGGNPLLPQQPQFTVPVFNSPRERGRATVHNSLIPMSRLSNPTKTTKPSLAKHQIKKFQAARDIVGSPLRPKPQQVRKNKRTKLAVTTESPLSIEQQATLEKKGAKEAESEGAKPKEGPKEGKKDGKKQRNKEGTKGPKEGAKVNVFKERRKVSRALGGETKAARALGGKNGRLASKSTNVVGGLPRLPADKENMDTNKNAPKRLSSNKIKPLAGVLQRKSRYV
jgi:hypothetical protein